MTLVESEIARLRARDKQYPCEQDRYGRTYEDRWASLKSVSHFNLGTALELMLKLLLRLNHKAVPKGKEGHQLPILLDCLPKSVKQLLESTFQNSRSVAPGGPDIIAIVATPAEAYNSLPEDKERGCKNLKDFFEYLDQVVRLSVKRYSQEEIQQQRPRYYLFDLSVFTTFIEHVMGNLERYVDPEGRVEHDETGPRQ